MRFSHVAEKALLTSEQSLAGALNLVKLLYKNFPERASDIIDIYVKIIENQRCKFLEIASDIMDCAEIFYEIAQLAETAYPDSICADEGYYDIDITDEFAQLLTSVYYRPRRNEFDNDYRRNIERINRCQYNYTARIDDSTATSIIPIVIDNETQVFIANKKLRVYSCISYVKDVGKDMGVGNIYLFYNMLSGRVVDDLFENYEKVKCLVGQKMPIYLHYSDDLSYSTIRYCQNVVEKLYSNNGNAAFVLTCGSINQNSYFGGIQARLPNKVLNAPQKVQNILSAISMKRNSLYSKQLGEIKEYYADEVNIKTIDKQVAQKELRILFITTLFSTAVQYHTRDIAKACIEAGYDVCVSKEKSPISTNSFDTATIIWEMKPNVTFIIDWYRTTGYNLIKSPYHVCWIQDLLPRLYDSAMINKLHNRDLVMYLFGRLGNFYNLYKGKNTMEGFVSANEQVYKPYEMSEDEETRYACDICLVCHDSDMAGKIKQYFPSDSWADTALRKLTMRYYEDAIEDKIIYTKDAYLNYGKMKLRRIVGSMSNEMQINQLAVKWSESMFPIISLPLYRNVIATWLVKSGFSNIKLWGSGWLNTEYRQYAMGAAENGEVLSKIIQSSKIVIGNNVVYTSTARVFETMLSGAFYLSNFIPPPDDPLPITKHLVEDKEIVVFKNRNDLLNKVKYYLEHENERRKIAQAGRRACLERMTYSSLVSRLAEKLSSMAKENLGLIDAI